MFVHSLAMTQINAHLMGKNIATNCWLNKETLWWLRYLETFPSDHQVPDAFQESIWYGIKAFQLIIVTGIVLNWWAQMWTRCLSNMVFGALRYSICYGVNMVSSIFSRNYWNFYGGPYMSRQIKFTTASSNSLWKIIIYHSKFTRWSRGKTGV